MWYHIIIFTVRLFYEGRRKIVKNGNCNRTSNDIERSERYHGRSGTKYFRLKRFSGRQKFIPKELGVSIREQLEAIDAKQTEIVSKYEMLDVQKPEMQHTAIEENLSEIQKVIEENEKYRKAIAFFWNFMPMMKKQRRHFRIERTGL